MLFLRQARRGGFFGGIFRLWEEENGIQFQSHNNGGTYSGDSGFFDRVNRYFV